MSPGGQNYMAPDKGHTKAALRAGATAQELMEAIWVAAEMRAGSAYAHAALTLATIEEEQQRQTKASGSI